MAETKKNQFSIEGLHSSVPREPVRVLKDRLKTGEDPEAQSVKAEINAMTAMYIEEIWTDSRELIASHPPGLLAYRRNSNYEDELEKDNFISDEVAKKKYLESGKDSNSVLHQLKRKSGNLILEEIEKWNEKRQSELKENPEAPSSKIFLRYKKIISDKHRLTDTMAAFPNTHIQRGVGTATKVIWNLFKVLPKVYRDSFNKDISPEQFQVIARNSLPVVYALASSHLGVFGKVEDSLKDGENLQYGSDSFRLQGEGEKMKLEINPEVLSNIDVSNIDFSEPRTGCPAIFSQGPSKRNVIAEMYDWCLDLANKYYVPNLKKDQ